MAHLDLAKDWRTDTVRDATNAHLRAEPVAILSAEIAPDGFSARMSARKRHYLYRILNRRSPPALDANRVWQVPWGLDETAMQDAAAMLVGRHDFTTFRASECQAKSSIRTLQRLDVTRAGDEIRVAAAARSFLHHQVIVGTLMLAGARRWTAEEVREALEARDRARCGPMAPASGLYLIGVDY